MLSFGIVGLPNAGKSSLFNALTRIQVPIANYPFTTIDPHRGVVYVPDERLFQLSRLTPKNKILPATIEFVDIAGLIQGSHRGEGLGNQFLSHIRETDGIVEVVRVFKDENVPHPMGTIDPIRDIKVIDYELSMADLKILENAIENYKGAARSGNKYAIEKLNVLEKSAIALRGNIPLRELYLDEAEKALLKEYNLLTIKPVIFVWNVDEDMKNFEIPNFEGIPLNIKLLSEITKLTEEELDNFKKELNLNENPLNYLIRKCYDALGFITFFTVKEPETRAWAIKRGTLLPEAGGKIHSDFEKKFIRAEVINISEILHFSSWQEAKSAGKIRIEGKNYVVEDGDVIEFKI
jgi:GTP-binding protein YchF